jgi:hypothetical protein
VRFAWGALFIILLLCSFIAGIAIKPCQASSLNDYINQTSSIHTNAVLADKETPFNNRLYQSSRLSLAVETDKSVYLTGEPVKITITTNAINTHVILEAQFPDGSKQNIQNFTFNYSRTIPWTAPATSGQITLSCDGDAIIEVQSTCTGVTCDSSGNCYLYSYPCTQSTTVKGSTSTDINVYGRATSISGYVKDSLGQPITGALVRLANDTAYKTTDSNGYYKLDYTIGDDYQLSNSQIPTATDTINFEAIACKPDSLKVQIPVEHGVNNADVTLHRFFYPPAIDLSKFTFDNFSNWTKAKNLETWQNILAISVERPTELKRLALEGKQLEANNDFKTFDIDGQTLYLITKPDTGRYFFNIECKQNSEYRVAASATLDSSPIEEIVLNDDIEAGKSQRIRLTLKDDSLELVRIKGFPMALAIIPIAISLAGGLAAAYFITGGKPGSLKKAFTSVKLPKLGKTAVESKPTEAVTPKPVRKTKKKRVPKTKAISSTKPRSRVEDKSKGIAETVVRRKTRRKSVASDKKQTKKQG